MGLTHHLQYLLNTHETLKTYVKHVLSAQHLIVAWTNGGLSARVCQCRARWPHETGRWCAKGKVGVAQAAVEQRAGGHGSGGCVGAAAMTQCREWVGMTAVVGVEGGVGSGQGGSDNAERGWR